MPDVKVYIRQENLEAWNSLPSKAEWINGKLGKLGESTLGGQVEKTKTASTVVQAPIRTVRTVPTVSSIPGLTTADKIKSNGTCKIHGLPLTSKGKCLQKKCKYA